MDKLLRKQPPIEVKNTFLGYTNFANLGAPREREDGEYVPNAILEKKQAVLKRMPIPHFKLVSDAGGFKEPNNISYAKYTLLALFIGISVMSFLTQGVLTIKDMVFNSSNNEVSSFAVNNSNNGIVNKVQSYSEDTQTEPLGSDDGAQNTSISNTLDQNQYANQYRLANEASFPRLS